MESIRALSAELAGAGNAARRNKAAQDIYRTLMWSAASGSRRLSGIGLLGLFMYLRKSLALQVQEQEQQRAAAGRARPAGDRSRAAHRQAHRADAPPADGARGRTRPSGAQPARRAGCAADRGQAGCGAHHVAAGRQRARGARTPGPPGGHAEQQHRAGAAHHRRPASVRRSATWGWPRRWRSWRASSPSAPACRCIARSQPVRLEPNAELVIYRVVQEAITNISKYAKASQVWITLAAVDGQIEVSVRDDGVGFDTTVEPAFGLRAGGHALSRRGRRRHADAALPPGTGHDGAGAAAAIGPEPG